jgi:hypothetical protein
MKRKGSALLIVLGVLSFLVVSAVAFSAFMRRARLPSSYLRRVVASRQLAKAALSEAIDQIDRAIADGVHPGVGGTQQNTWNDRVFFKGGGEQSVVLTAPTLTLEGLAYIPPPLVNEARYWSRKTPTAVWQNIPYDVGRYAYCAIDVSDYFDVNRLVADYPRSSAANRRVTIAHLFEDVNHRQAPTGADQWDDFMEKFRTIDKDTLEIDFESASKIPLVSLADFNLALADKGSVGDLKSPFGEYIKNASGSFYPGNSQKELETYAAMTFVTDGWFPKVKKTGADGKETTTYDLSNEKYQPFQMTSLKKSNPIKLSGAALSTGLNSQSAETKDLWFRRLSGLGCAVLADYLDADRVPISLAIPTAERVPMICGIKPEIAQQASFAVEKSEGQMTGPNGGALDEGGQATEREVEQQLKWKVKVGEFRKFFLGSKLKTLVAFPFLHEDEGDKSFTLDGKMSLFLTSDAEIPLRTENQGDVLHLDRPMLPNSDLNTGTGVMNVKLEGGRPSFNKTITQERDAVWSGALPLNDGQEVAGRFAQDGNELLSVTFRWKQTRQKNPNGGFSEWKPDFQTVQEDPGGNGASVVKAHTVLPALGGRGSRSAGAPDEDFSDARLAQNLTGNANWSKKVFLNVAVWLRIKDSDGKIVDMAPASIADDSIQNQINDPLARVFSQTGSQKIDGQPYPVLRFSTGVSFDFGIKGMSALEGEGQQIDLSPKALMAGDPRFNHAPENWFSEAGGEVSEETWLQKNGTSADGRDGDIFMATSDAGYLQSIYELAFLPRFTDLRNYGNSQIAGNCAVPNGSFNNDQYADSVARTLNYDMMWRTYDPIDMDEQAFEDFPFTSEGTGMKVNPYSNSTNVLMAAFANTPVDWRRASTNAMDGTTDYAAMDVKSFNQKYAWNEYSTGGAIAWEDLEKVAGKFMDRVRASGNAGWKSVWNDLGWYNDGEGEFLGVKTTGNTDEMWDADRKFLYGFWRDCFDAKQQLFLIFVRAEPLLLGGGMADQLPPQLGARAVALVWRDPATSSKSTGGYPHRTRVLFYKPLD